MTRRWWLVLLLLLAPIAQAASVHVFLDRDHVSLGDTVTLNIQSDAPIGTPDLAALAPDFEILGSSSSSSVEVRNGRSSSVTQLGIALKPLHAGALTIPSFDVAGTPTPPLVLHVSAAPSGGSGRVGDPAFIESSVLSSSPYVGQQTVYTVRLFYLPGVDGSMGDPSADGARLIPLDRDHRYLVDRDGYTYQVLERSWALIPDRAGPVRVQGPEFQGQQLNAGNPGALMIDPNQLLRNPGAILRRGFPGFGTTVRASSPVVGLDARTAPANGGKPWLPARSVKLQLTGLPANGKVDGAAPLSLSLSVTADGQPAGALPEPELPPIAGARIYPDQPRDTTDDTGEWLHGTRTRSFAIVPDRNGRIEIPAITLNWWNVATGQPEQASVAAHVLDVSGVAVSAPVAAPPAANASPAPAAALPAIAAPAIAVARGVPWRAVALTSLALWVLAIIAAAAWWRLRGRRAPDIARSAGAGGAVRSGGAASAGTPAVAGVPEQVPHPRGLEREALDAARAHDVVRTEHALLAWARALRPGLVGVGDVREALVDPAQRDALALLQRARWQGGDGASACSAVASAFARGFRWLSLENAAQPRPSALPPLYPS